MSGLERKCKICHKEYTSERRDTVNLHTGLSVCISCDSDLTQAQYNYRKWGLKIGHDIQ